VDAATGTEISFSAFYLAPILFGGWYGGPIVGLALSALSAGDWYALELAGAPFSHPAVPYWNAGMRFMLYAISTVAIARLQDSVRKERELARTDPLTGVANGRTFDETIGLEVRRARRSGLPFTVSYMDLDDFKQVNDRFGHPVGDRVLVAVAATIRQQMRVTDLVARLGGDEFAIFQPDTDAEGARTSLAKLREAVLAAMRANGWPVTLSIGSATFRTPPADASELIKRADRLLYQVKRAGKNDLLHEVADEGRQQVDRAEERAAL